MRILIAGARGGIGGACCDLLEERGAAVIRVDSPEHNITLPGGAESALDYALEQLGGLDGIVHAVGMSGRSLGDGPVSACTDQAWSEVLRVNTESVFRLMRAGLPRLSDSGSFVVIGSVLSESSDPDFLTAAYAASKAAIVGLMRTAAMEFAPRGIRVNVVNAGLVDTPMSRRANGDPRISERVRQLQPLGGAPVDAEVIAQAVAWLLSPDASRTTGACLPVDGGWLIR